MNQEGQLYLVATPIGNLSDITLRAIETLKTVDWIAAEDTRHSQRLLSHYQINTPLFSLHEHNEDGRIEKVAQLLSDGKSVALISDAGTPLISDPGFRLVRSLSEREFKLIPVPGACALIAALTVSGLPTDRFTFEGFLPVKSGALMTRLAGLEKETRTMIFYESVHRIEKTLMAFCEAFGGARIAAVARELTKTYETIKQGNLEALLDWIRQNPVQKKGEFVIVLQGVQLVDNSTEVVVALDNLLKTLLKEMPLKQAVKLACDIMQLKKKPVYKRALELLAIISNE